VWRAGRQKTARKRGPKAKVVDSKIRQLEREIAKLRRRNERVELMISIQKKASELLRPVKWNYVYSCVDFGRPGCQMRIFGGRLSS